MRQKVGREAVDLRLISGPGMVASRCLGCGFGRLRLYWLECVWSLRPQGGAGISDGIFTGDSIVEDVPTSTKPECLNLWGLF